MVAALSCVAADVSKVKDETTVVIVRKNGGNPITVPAKKACGDAGT